jgi:hypothetical protein
VEDNYVTSLTVNGIVYKYETTVGTQRDTTVEITDRISRRLEFAVETA